MGRRLPGRRCAGVGRGGQREDLLWLGRAQGGAAGRGSSAAPDGAGFGRQTALRRFPRQPGSTVGAPRLSGGFLVPVCQHVRRRGGSPRCPAIPAQAAAREGGELERRPGVRGTCRTWAGPARGLWPSTQGLLRWGPASSMSCRCAPFPTTGRPTLRELVPWLWEAAESRAPPGLRSELEPPRLPLSPPPPQAPGCLSRCPQCDTGAGGGRPLPRKGLSQ